jgi:hypothetical protein
MNNDYERYNFWHLEAEQIKPKQVEDIKPKQEQQPTVEDKPELSFGNK